jgi:multisubunit Na+/H+ antiporter MnhC subunit
MEIFSNSFLIWIVVAGAGLLVLRFILNVTKKILTLGILFCAAVAIYLLISNFLSTGSLPSF